MSCALSVNRARFRDTLYLDIVLQESSSVVYFFSRQAKDLLLEFVISFPQGFVFEGGHFFQWYKVILYKRVSKLRKQQACRFSEHE